MIPSISVAGPDIESLAVIVWLFGWWTLLLVAKTRGKRLPGFETVAILFCIAHSNTDKLFCNSAETAHHKEKKIAVWLGGAQIGHAFVYIYFMVGEV
jgi:hypothetical protein